MRWTQAELATFNARRSRAYENLKNNQTRTGKVKRHIVTATELQVHLAVAGHLRARGEPGVFWAHYPAGEVRDERTASKLKAMGTKPGVPDLLLLIGGKLHGLELKRDDGRLSPEQRACHAEIEAAGGFVATAWGVDSALAILEAWGALRVDTAQKGTQANV